MGRASCSPQPHALTLCRRQWCLRCLSVGVCPGVVRPPPLAAGDSLRLRSGRSGSGGSSAWEGTHLSLAASASPQGCPSTSLPRTSKAAACEAAGHLSLPQEGNFHQALQQPPPPPREFRERVSERCPLSAVDANVICGDRGRDAGVKREKPRLHPCITQCVPCRTPCSAR